MGFDGHKQEKEKPAQGGLFSFSTISSEYQVEGVSLPGLLSQVGL
jgi:hypothetical protein